VLVTFVATFLTYAAFLFHVGDVTFHYDSGGYWANAALFTSSGSFDLSSYSDSLRGYSFPLLLRGLIELANLLSVSPTALFRVASAFLFAWGTAYVFPGVLQLLGLRVSLAGRLGFAALIFVFWRGYALYPLTDFLSLALLCTAMLLVWSWSQRILTSFVVPVLALGAAGLLIAVATNTRPSYQLAFAAVFAWVLVVSIQRRRALRGIMSVSVFVIAFSVVLGPQAYINVENDRAANPFHSGFTESEDLYKLQLARGLHVQRFESNVDDPNWPDGAVASIDPMGPIREQEFVSCCRKDLAGQATHAEYIRNVLHHPKSMLSMFAMHTFAGLDLWHPTVYLDTVRPSPWFRLLNYTLLYAAAAGGMWILLRHRSGTFPTAAVLLASAALLPSLIAVPGQVETRFFLPVYVLAYGIVSFAVLPWLLRPGRWVPAPALSVGAGYLAWLALAFHLSQQLYDRLQHIT
jgi:hypothetical protein